ncbi:helix-turn-helix domain-containing protein [Acidipropionibacterium jensenii]|uniref:helix-turn-helix domain-containing protein n=1 Tax=Acidipropionibacterium jensenii TaxID=1749 RepID=UPI00214B21E7|nr:helix-turn-helix domain-containing protein [Acidipropionibacterium jensenii]
MPTTKTKPAKGAGSIPEQAERWGVSTDWVRKQIASGALKIYRRGKIIRIKDADMDALFTTYGGDR